MSSPAADPPAFFCYGCAKFTRTPFPGGYRGRCATCCKPARPGAEARRYHAGKSYFKAGTLTYFSKL